MHLSHHFVGLLEKATNGDEVAMFGVAECYAEGVGVSEDQCLAFHWYRKAANSGDVDAMYEVARCYLTGAGTQLNIDLCRSWLRKAYGSDQLSTVATERRAQVRAGILQLMLADGGS